MNRSDISISYGNEYTIRKVLEREKVSGLYLPHFQRNFVWDIEDQKNLICSLLAGIPIGGILILEGLRSDYAYRVLGHNLWDSVEPGHHTHCLFLLDGQQRLSALKTICSDPFSEDSLRVLTNEKDFVKQISSWEDIVRYTDNKLRNRWFIDLDRSSNEEDIFGCRDLKFNKNIDKTPEDYEPYIVQEKINITHYSLFTPSRPLIEIRKAAVRDKKIPLWLLMGNENEEDALRRIISDIAQEFKSAKEMLEDKEVEPHVSTAWQTDILNFLEGRICDAVIPDITLERGEDKLGVGIAIFEMTNRQGTRLSTYDLISARMANKDRHKNLTQHIRGTFEAEQSKDWNPHKKGLGLWDEREEMPTLAFQKAFLACLGMECFLKRKQYSKLVADITKETFLLKLSAQEINDSWKDVVQIFLKIFYFLHKKCGLVEIGSLQYRLMLLPLYKVFRELNVNHTIENKCEYWYWASLFSGRFREGQNPRAIEDCDLLYKFCSTDENPFREREKNVFRDKGYSDFDNLGRYSEGRNYNKGLDSVILQYIISDGALDLKLKDNDNQPVRITTWAIAKGNISINISHLASLGDYKRGDDKPINSPLNLTYLDAQTNKSLGTDTSHYHRLLIRGPYKESHLLPDSFENLVEAYKKAMSEEDIQLTLKELLEARYDKIVKDVQNRLSRLISS